MATVYRRRSGGPEIVLVRMDATHVTLGAPGGPRAKDIMLPIRTFEEDFVVVSEAEPVQRRCRGCGIEHIELGMVDARGEVLAWTDHDQCTACQEDEAEAERRDAGRYRYLRNRKTSDAEIWLGDVFAGMVPQNVILGGEDLDRAVDRAMGKEPSTGQTLERRLADCLADAIDTPIMKVRDTLGGPEIELRLGAWLTELSERAAELLEEAGR